jgi:hypothetical protein
MPMAKRHTYGVAPRWYNYLSDCGIYKFIDLTYVGIMIKLVSVVVILLCLFCRTSCVMLALISVAGAAYSCLYSVRH